MPSTDLTQSINRNEAHRLTKRMAAVHLELGELVKGLCGNGHDDAPEYLDDAVDLVSSAIASVNAEVDEAQERAA